MLKPLTSGADLARVERALATFYRTERSTYGLEQIDTDGLPDYVGIIQRFAPRGASVLEFGAGTWRSPLMLQRAGFCVVGCDLFSEADLAAFRERIGDAAHLVNYDGRRVPLPDASVNVVTSRNVFEHILHVDSMLDELDRVLAPGGVFMLAGRSELEPSTQRDSGGAPAVSRGRSLLALRAPVTGGGWSAPQLRLGPQRPRRAPAPLPADRDQNARRQDPFS